MYETVDGHVLFAAILAYPPSVNAFAAGIATCAEYTRKVSPSYQ
jgi:hypothetical protein